MTTSASNGYLQVTTAGHYMVICRGNFIPSTSGSTFSFSIGIDSGSGFVSQDPNVVSPISTTGTTTTYNFNLVAILNLAANDKIYVIVKEAAGNEATFKHVVILSNRIN